MQAPGFSRGVVDGPSPALTTTNRDRGRRSGAQPLQHVIAHAQGIRDDSERGVDRADAGEEAGIYHVEIVHLMRAAVGIQHRGRGIASKAAGARLVANARDRNLRLQIEIA